MLTWLVIGLLGVAGVTGLVAATFRAISIRQTELSCRIPFPLSEWERLHPELDSESIAKSISAIAAGLGVDGEFLRPDDRFDGSLALRGSFIIDDDTLEDVAEKVEEQLGIKWKNEWESVGEAVSGISAQIAVPLNNSIRRNDGR